MQLSLIVGATTKPGRLAQAVDVLAESLITRCPDDEISTINLAHHHLALCDDERTTTTTRRPAQSSSRF